MVENFRPVLCSDRLDYEQSTRSIGMVYAASPGMSRGALGRLPARISGAEPIGFGWLVATRSGAYRWASRGRHLDRRHLVQGCWRL